MMRLMLAVISAAALIARILNPVTMCYVLGPRGGLYPGPMRLWPWDPACAPQWTVSVWMTLLQIAVLGVVLAWAARGVRVPHLSVSWRQHSRRLIFLAVLVCAALLVWDWVSANSITQQENQERTRAAQDRYAHTIVEGEHLGPVAIGMTLDAVKNVMTHPFDGAVKNKDGSIEYQWWDDAGRWRIGFEARTRGVVYARYFATHVPIAQWAVATSRGLRYGQDLGTVKAIYDAPWTKYCDESFFDLYYPSLRTAFAVEADENTSWNCTLDKETAKAGWEIDNPGELVEIAIYAPGYRPLWVKK